ncbi:hypothetical protein [Flavobacterium sp. HBTb2-11-1]|uniref:hypothetical protein n=1 Tax=Flavobacterium sp. HBTb2-11-1 TaxID=2692212 RepID=UPI0013719A88|nr:hypothetical protein [Flavobacterium sp. HBTb2-11-1]MXO03493.1 hypothetical protein [Flavobacterium sp. HBTb2-11-1]
MKKVIIPILSLAFFLNSCGNTQKKDKQNEERKAEQAEKSIDNAAIDQEMSNENAANAVVESIQANIDKAMSKVALPKFSKLNATILAEEFHKDLSELVNTNSNEKANKYADKLDSLRKTYEKKVTDKKLDPKDKATLDKYVNDLLTAVQNAE